MAVIDDVITSAFEELSAPELMSKKSEIEEEIREFLQVLESQGGVGMNGSLIDSEKFPRNDIDLYAVRTARQKVIRLRNDHKTLMRVIESKLHELHAESKEKRTSQSDTQVAIHTKRDIGMLREKVFARVTMVSPGSPADKAELKNGDLLLEFGSVNISNFSNVTDIGKVVQNSEGTRISVQVLRGDNKIGISLIPKRWGGRGLLGCMVNPI